jgi:hypothetical protein
MIGLGVRTGNWEFNAAGCVLPPILAHEIILRFKFAICEVSRFVSSCGLGGFLLNNAKLCKRVHSIHTLL